MRDILIQILFGWPAILFSLAVSATGILKNWPWMLLVGGFVIIPFSFYLSGYPFIRYLAFLLPFFQVGAAWALRSKKKILACVLLLPLAVVSVVLATLVLTQN